MRRRRTFRRRGDITREAVEAFRRGDHHALRVELRLKPWQWPTPSDVQDDETCGYPKGSGGALWWPECMELRRELKAMAAEFDRLAAPAKEATGP